MLHPHLIVPGPFVGTVHSARLPWAKHRVARVPKLHEGAHGSDRYEH